MKIAVWHNIPSGGGKRALYYHVRGLVERGHEVACWSLDTVDHAYLPLSEFAVEHIVALPSLQSARRQIVRNSLYRQAINEMRAFDEVSRRCAREIEAGDFDVLFANTTLPYHVPFIVRHLRMPKVLYLQEPCRWLYEASPILPWAAGAEDDLARAGSFNLLKFKRDYSRLQALRLQAKQEWINIRACDEVLVNSYFSRESVRRIYGVDSKVCYLGIDTSLFRDLALERERIIVGLGAFYSNKGIDLALKAVALLAHPRPRLVWIANSVSVSYRAEMDKLADSLGVDLTVKEGISNDELVTILNTAALFVYTSRLEPFGLAPLEANACGLPVVAVAEGGIRETIKDGFNGFLVDPEPTAIAEAAKLLLQNPDLTRQISQQAAAHVRQNWNLEGCVDRLENVLLKTVATEPKKTTFDAKRVMSNLEEVERKPKKVERDSHQSACTIIAKNYLAYARTLAQSFLSVHPEHKFYVLVVDEFEGYINPAEESFVIVSLTDLEIPNLQSFCFKYSVVELCTAAKPYLMDYLISEKGVAKLLYLDPDILVTAPLNALYEKLETYDIALTPHLDADYPADGLQPDDGYILRAGVFNLGFIGINASENALAFLSWWKSKLYNDCVVDVANGYFVDQKFIDLATVFFGNIFVEKDTGYNVAYWNLHTREIGKRDGIWLCNGEPLYFFHFSGYVLENSEISKYLASDTSRHNFSRRPDLLPLFDEYKDLVIRNGYNTASKWNYTFANFETGEPIPKELRNQYRRSPSQWCEYDNPFASKRLIATAERLNLRADKLTRNTLITPEEQLENILNSRAWRWVARYGRLKSRFLHTANDLLRRPSRKKV